MRPACLPKKMSHRLDLNLSLYVRHPSDVKFFIFRSCLRRNQPEPFRHPAPGESNFSVAGIKLTYITDMKNHTS